MDKNIIEEIFTKTINDFSNKCTNDYPKANALRSFYENPSRFKSEDYGGVFAEELPSPIGRLQGIQERLQSRIDYEPLEKGVVHAYATNDFGPMNEYIYKKPGWDTYKPFRMGVLDKEGNFEVKPVLGKDGWESLTVPEEIKLLDKTIEKSPPLQEDSILYRYGSLPEGIQVGDHSKMEGYMSTSFNEYVAFDNIPNGGTWKMSHDKRYRMRIYAPKGTKGVVPCNDLECMDWQSEFLIGRNQKFIVLNMDEESRTADILLY